MGFNPRYLAYCRSNKNSPEEQLKSDKKEWPGGCMCGYILWIKDQRLQLFKEKGLDPKGIYSGIEEMFDQWLNEKYPENE